MSIAPNIRPESIRFDRSKNTWRVMRGSTPIKYCATEEAAKEWLITNTLMERVYLMFFQRLEPTSTEAQRSYQALEKIRNR